MNDQQSSEMESNLNGCYAVIFTSKRAASHGHEYHSTGERMMELARHQPGFLGVDSARGADDVGITVSYWLNEESIRLWREHAEHALAREQGRSTWYEWFNVRVCKVERAYGPPRPD